MTQTIIYGALWFAMLVACAGFAVVCVQIAAQREYRVVAGIFLFIFIGFAALAAHKSGNALSQIHQMATTKR